MTEIRVLGMGNVLCGDDALGPTIAHRLLSRFEIPDEVEIVDIGTPGLDLIPYICGPRAIILVDTVHSDGKPGELRLYRREDLSKNPPGPRTTPHDPALPQALMTAELAGEVPEDFLLVGIIPENTEQELGLSAPVAAAVETAEQAVLGELRRLGVELRLREAPDTAPPWWAKVP